jgi:CxxC motif-containing protein
MAPRETVICIGCPLGCRVTVVQDKKGNITGMKGAECKQGEKYVLKELQNPVRTLTATVRTGDESLPLLPVRTSRPVLKVMLKPIMVETAKVKARPPVKAGDVIVKNVLKTKADLIATTDWQAGAGEG